MRPRRPPPVPRSRAGRSRRRRSPAGSTAAPHRPATPAARPCRTPGPAASPPPLRRRNRATSGNGAGLLQVGRLGGQVGPVGPRGQANREDIAPRRGVPRPRQQRQDRGFDLHPAQLADPLLDLVSGHARQANRRALHQGVPSLLPIQEGHQVFRQTVIAGRVARELPRGGHRDQNAEVGRRHQAFPDASRSVTSSRWRLRARMT